MQKFDRQAGRAWQTAAGTAAGAAVAATLAVLAILALPAGAEAATPVTGTPGCLPSSKGVTVHYELGQASGPEPGIAGLTLQGFDSHTCDGQPVVVTLSGNAAGDPSAGATELLSTLDSSRDACTGDKLEQPELIDNGTITLTGCAGTDDAHRGAYASVHDLTLLTVSVSGRTVPTGSEVLGTSATRPHAGSDEPGGAQVLGIQASRPRAGSGLLAFTGGPQPLMFWGGLLLLVFGVASLVLDRLRDTRAAWVGLTKERRERRS